MGGESPDVSYKICDISTLIETSIPFNAKIQMARAKDGKTVLSAVEIHEVPKPNELLVFERGDGEWEPSLLLPVENPYYHVMGPDPAGELWLITTAGFKGSPLAQLHREGPGVWGSSTIDTEALGISEGCAPIGLASRTPQAYLLCSGFLLRGTFGGSWESMGQALPKKFLGLLGPTITTEPSGAIQLWWMTKPSKPTEFAAYKELWRRTVNSDGTKTEPSIAVDALSKYEGGDTWRLRDVAIIQTEEEASLLLEEEQTQGMSGRVLSCDVLNGVPQKRQPVAPPIYTVAVGGIALSGGRLLGLTVSIGKLQFAERDSNKLWSKSFVLFDSFETHKDGQTTSFPEFGAVERPDGTIDVAWVEDWWGISDGGFALRAARLCPK